MSDLPTEPTYLHGGEDTYEQRPGESFRRCSYCGGVHPIDLLRARDEGKIGKVDRSVDWKYGWPHKIYVDVDGSYAKFYNIHTMEPGLNDDERKKLFEFVGYSFEMEGTKIKWKRWVYDMPPTQPTKVFPPLAQAFLNVPVTFNFDHNPRGEVVAAWEEEDGVRVTMRMDDGTIFNAAVGKLIYED